MYKNLRALRESLHMKQEEFGASVGVKKTTYQGYETGQREPRSDFWIAVAETYKVSIDYLMGFTDDPKGTRHGYATLLYEAGIPDKDAQELLGHSSIAVTRDVYTHIRSSRKQETAQKLNKFVMQKDVILPSESDGNEPTSPK